MSAMNKAKIIMELENMVVARLFSREPCLADRETLVALDAFSGVLDFCWPFFCRPFFPEQLEGRSHGFLG